MKFIIHADNTVEDCCRHLRREQLIYSRGQDVAIMYDNTIYSLHNAATTQRENTHDSNMIEQEYAMFTCTVSTYFHLLSHTYALFIIKQPLTHDIS